MSGPSFQVGRALLVLRSGNAKLGEGCATTYVSLAASCPRTCPLYGSPECYTSDVRVGGTVRRLEQSGGARDAARDEAVTIRRGAARAKPGQALRLHTAGDCRTPTAARLVSSAAAMWPGPVWTYTHAWRDVRRSAWGKVSVLGSVESLTDGRAVMRRGYAPAAIVAEHPQDGRAFEAHGVTWIPCPAQTRGVTCAECRLCWAANKLRARETGITFEAHGPGAARLKRRLTVVS